MRRRLLGLFPHPDDEGYSAGGLLASCVLSGAQVYVVCATRGEGHGDPALRSAELAAACAALGLPEPPRFLDLPDGGLEPIADGPARIAALLDALGPDVVVCLGRDGAYGHRDHLALTRWIQAAAAGRPLRVLHAAFPRDLFAPVRRAMRRFRPELIGFRGPLGVAPADLVLDIRPVRDRKLAAIAAHRSQLPPEGPLCFLRPGLVERLLDEERFTLAAGPPLPAGANDPFAGLDP